jgi:hypothetical protein
LSIYFFILFEKNALLINRKTRSNKTIPLQLFRNTLNEAKFKLVSTKKIIYGFGIGSYKDLDH